MPHSQTGSTPTFASRKYSGGTSPTNRAFVIEALVLLAFLAVSIAIVLQLFATAGMQSREAHVLSTAEHLVTNAAERFGANPRQENTTLYYDEQGSRQELESNAAFEVVTDINPVAQQTGTTYVAHITVTNLKTNGDPEIVYELDTQRYLSASEGGGAL